MGVEMHCVAGHYSPRARVRVTVAALAAVIVTMTMATSAWAAAPVVDKLTPNVGPAAGGTTVTIRGTGFAGTTAVDFGSTSAASFEVDSSTTIMAVSPPGTTGGAELTVTTPSGTSAISLHDHFTYGPPTVTGLSPNGGTTAGGASTTITGSGFGLGTVATSFKFSSGTLATSVSCASTTSCTVVVPAHRAGIFNVKASVAGKGSPQNSPADDFTYIRPISNGMLAWGDNSLGQLGDGTSSDSDVPVAVSVSTGVKQISAGYFHSLALLSNGTVVAWGENDLGQLGDGTTTTSDVPVAVSGLSGVTAVAAGGDHSLALLSNGTVMAWGYNQYGQLGDGTATGPEMCGSQACSRVPVAVSGLTGVTAIAAGSGHSLALLGDGTVMAWDITGTASSAMAR
jgi:hypothetical protein